MAKHHLSRDILAQYFHYDPIEGTLAWRADRPRDGLSDHALNSWVANHGGRLVNLGGPNDRKAVKLNGVSLHVRRIAAALTFGELPKDSIVYSRNGDLSDIRASNLQVEQPQKRMRLGQGVAASLDLTREMFEPYFRYEADTGRLFWRSDRPTDGMSSATYRAWQTKNGGKEAGTLKTCRSGLRYVSVFVNRKAYGAHRIIIALTRGFIGRNEEVDHLNGIGTDNRLLNLRVVDGSINSRNRKLPRHSSSGHVGVLRHKKTNKWQAVDHKRKSLGLFITLEEAVAARMAWQEKEGGFTERHGT